MSNSDKTTISLIWAMNPEHVIGINNRLPWKLPVDMRWFRQHTLGKPIVMGRNTYESFGSRALPQRTNIVISTQKDYHCEDALVANSIDEAIDIAAKHGKEIMIIGGARIYEQTIELAQRLYLTLVHADVQGDAYFPEFDQSKWRVIQSQSHKADDKNSHDCEFIVMERA